MNDKHSFNGYARDLDQPTLDRIAEGRAHILVSIGYTGIKKCYLDLSWDECRSQYMKDTGTSPEDFAEIWANAFGFDQTFDAYEVSEPSA